MRYKATRSKIFRSTTDNGKSVKNRVFLTELPDGTTGIAIKMLCLSDINIDGWDPVKTYKELTMYMSAMHIRLSTLNKVIEKIYELQDEYS